VTIDPEVYFTNAVAMLVLCTLALVWLHAWWTQGSVVHLLAYCLAMLVLGRVVWAYV